MLWTATLDDAVRGHLAAGHSFSEIAKAVGLSRDQVLGRARRLRAAGVTGFVRDGDFVVDPVPSSAPRIRLLSRKPAWQPESDRVAGLPLGDQIGPDRVGRRVDFFNLRANDCRWPIADGTYCGQPIHKKSFCTFHHGLAYRKGGCDA
jgi:hypothetical protein